MAGGYRKLIGMSTPVPPGAANETTNRGGEYPVVNSSRPSSVAMAVVTVTSLVLLVALLVLIVILRRKRIREERLNRLNRSSVVQSVVEDGKAGDQEAAQSAVGKWRSGSVDLVVMAGETTPTFVAHPVPAPFTNTHVVIECPPLVT